VTTKLHGQTGEGSARIVGCIARLQSALALLRGKLNLLRSDFALLAVTWWGFAMLEVTLHLIIPQGALRSQDLPVGARFLLLCYSLTLLAFFLLLTGAVIKIAFRTSSKFVPDRLGLRLIVRIVITLLVWFGLVFYLASWGLFWQTGSFIDSQVFIFMAPHPLQVFHWVDLDVALVVVAFAGAGAFTITVWIPHWIARQPGRSQEKVVFVWRWALGFSVLGAFLGTLYSSWGERQFMRAGILYSRNQVNRSGPISYVVADIAKHMSTSGEPLPIDNSNSFQITQRPIISLNQYKILADQSRRHRWNVLILTIESLRADQIRAYGGSRDVMPAVETLTKDARVFLNTYTQSSHTNYAAITPLSSHYPLRSATAYTYPKNPTYPRVLIYDVLKTAGYHTAIFSSSNENWGGMINYLETGNLDRFIHAANSKRPTYLMQGDAAFAIWARESQHAGSLDDRSTVDEAIQWIDGLDNESFFIAMNFQNSHLPYPVPPEFPRRFGPAKLDFTIRFAYFPKDKIQVVKDVYADSLAYVDSQIARLFQHLKEKNRWENTLVVVTGDHGQAFYEHGFASHASAIFDEVMKVPLIIRAPGLKAGRDDRLAQHIDIAPSVLGLLALPIHPSFQGIDLFNAARDPKRSVYMVAQTPDAYQYGIVRSGFKLIYDERQREYLLFNVAADPGENNDIAVSQPAMVKDLANRLNAWRKLQIDYYSNPALQTREYPPILRD
jgi:arylsulfatase A-like enzyme